MSSQPDTSMSINSLMQAIYGDHHTQYTLEHEQQNLEQIPQFMLSLISHLQQLCVTQGFADNVNRNLQPWIKQVKTNQRNPKPALQGFLHQFLRLFEQQTQKIKKYGQKKLKYLTQTVSKQIFTQIMRMACDMKLQSVNRINHLRSAYKKTNNITIFSHCINKLYIKDIHSCFKTLKKSYIQDTIKQQGFINKLLKSINNLNKICHKNKRSQLWIIMSMWRLRNIEISQQQSIFIYRESKQFYRAVLPQIVKCWQTKPTNWLSVVIQNLSKVLQHTLGSLQGISIQFMPHPNLQHHNSLDYSALSSHRSSISQLSYIPVAQYLKNQQIKYDNANKYVAIPIIAQQQIGLITISWYYQLPIFIFNRILKLIEIIKSIIISFGKITNRLTYHSMEFQNNLWQEGLYQLALKEQFVEVGKFQEILDNVHINFLEIYHDRKIVSSCIKYGKQNVMPIPQNIYKIIWDKLQTVYSFKLQRDNKIYQIIKLDGGEGFCRYSFEQQQDKSYEHQPEKNTIIKCIVPILTKNLGKIGCKSCNIKIKQCKLNKQQYIDLDLTQRRSTKSNIKITKQRVSQQFGNSLILKMRNVHTINQAQKYMMDYLKESLQLPVYVRLFYLVSQSKNLYAYRKITKSTSMIQLIQIPKILINQNICTIQPQQRKNNKFNKIISVMQQNPLFSDSQIYLYQKQVSNCYRIYPKKIGRKALIMLATYQNIPAYQIQQVVSLLANQLNLNINLFFKEDLYHWASRLILQTQAVNCCDQKFNNQLCIIDNIKKQSAGFGEIIEDVLKNLVNVQKYYLWSVGHNKVTQLNRKTQKKKIMLSEFPYKQLSQQAIKSHQFVKGSHKIIQLSKYYGQRLQQYFTYIPNFATEQQKLNYAEIVCEGNQYQEMGQCTDSRYLKVQDYLQKMYKLDKKMHQFISIPVHYQNKVYIIVLQYSRCLIISDQYFKAITKYTGRIVLQLLQTKYSQFKQNCLLIIKSGILMNSKKNKLKQTLKKFQENKKFIQQRNYKLESGIEEANYKIYYRTMKQYFSLIKNKALYVKNVYQKTTGLLISRLLRIFGFNPLINKLRKHNIIKKSTEKLQFVLYKLINSTLMQARSTRNSVFELLKRNHQKIKQIIKQNKQNSSFLIHKIVSNIQRRNLNQFFIKNIQNLNSLKRSLLILQQEFALISPKNIKKCLQFLTGRLSLMLSQYCTTPLDIIIANTNYNNNQPSIKNILSSGRSVFVKNSSFIFQLKSQITQNKLNVAQKQIQQVLQKLLPIWQINHRKHQINHLHTLQKIFQTIKYKNLRHLFSTTISQTNKQNINQHNNLQQKTIEQSKKLQQLQSYCNSYQNLQNRQKHKKIMDQLKNQTNLLQNQLYKIGVDMRIKSKTNAAFRIISLMNRKSNQNTKTKYIQQRKYVKQDEQDITRKLKDVINSCQEDQFRYNREVVPLWYCKVNRIINKNLKHQAKLFFSLVE